MGRWPFRATGRAKLLKRGSGMDTLMMKSGGWFALALLALVGYIEAADAGFAAHMAIVSATALFLAFWTLKSADYMALASPAPSSQAVEDRYYDAVIRWGVIATVFWAVVGLLVGVFIAAQLFFPQLNLGEYLSFGRLRPLHTSAVIFAFGGNALIATSFYVVQ